MKLQNHVAAMGVASLIALVLSVPVSAQHSRYKLIDLGTFGGPNSFVNGDPPPLINDKGAVAGAADTATPCPYPGGFVSDGVLQPAFAWRNGVLINLGLLRGGCFTLPNSINAKGMMVGSGDIGVIDDTDGLPIIHADFRYKGQVLDLGTFGGSNSLASQVNDRGQVVGGAENTDPDPWNFAGITLELPSPTAWHAFLWQAGAMRDLGTLGGPDSFASSVNQNGQAAGFSFTNSTPNSTTGIPTVDPFFWDGNKMTDIGTLGGTFGLVGAINNKGQVAGISYLSGDVNHHSFVWENGVLTDIGTLGGDNSDTAWINNSGVVVGSADLPDGTHHAFTWQNGTMTDLGTMGGDPCSLGEYINAKGQAVGRSTDCHGATLHTFLWENGTMVDLSSQALPGSGFASVDPVAINDAGEIVGEGALIAGGNHVVVLKPCSNDCSPQITAVLNNASPANQISSHSKVAMHDEMSKSVLDRSFLKH